MLLMLLAVALITCLTSLTMQDAIHRSGAQLTLSCLLTPQKGTCRRHLGGQTRVGGIRRGAI